VPCARWRDAESNLLNPVSSSWVSTLVDLHVTASHPAATLTCTRRIGKPFGVTEDRPPPTPLRWYDLERRRVASRSHRIVFATRSRRFIS
jgi:hypothetical protein